MSQLCFGFPGFSFLRYVVNQLQITSGILNARLQEYCVNKIHTSSKFICIRMFTSNFSLPVIVFLKFAALETGTSCFTNCYLICRHSLLEHCRTLQGRRLCRLTPFRLISGLVLSMIFLKPIPSLYFFKNIGHYFQLSILLCSCNSM